MKSLIKRVLVFLLVTFIFIESVSMLMLVTGIYLINHPGQEIYTSIAKSKKRNSVRTLLLGDSVGRQLFANNKSHSGFNSLACNQSIGLVGQYLLLNDYLNAGNEIDKVVILLTPTSFENNLDQIYTYHYFIKPFYNTDYMPLLSRIVKDQVRKIPYHEFVKLPHIRISSWAPNYEPVDPLVSRFLSPISSEYLTKIKDLSLKNNFELKLLSTPVDIAQKQRIDKINQNEFSQINMEAEFKSYFDNMVFLESSEFRDETHLVQPESYVEALRAQIMN